MSVHKFKDFKSAEEALWHFNCDADYIHQLKEANHLRNELNHPHNKKGVFKFKTLQDANDFSNNINLDYAVKHERSMLKGRKH